MTYSEDANTFTCANGRKLTLLYIQKRKTKTGFIRKTQVYRCTNCEDCSMRSACQRLKQGELLKGPKRVYFSKNYKELLAENKNTFESTHGIHLRLNRSIQVEGIFSALKQDYGFKRFLHKGSVKVHKELLLLAMGFNLQKLHNRNIKGRIGVRLFKEEIIA